MRAAIARERAKTQALEQELAICRDAIETCYEVAENLPSDDDGDAAVRRCTLRRLNEAIGKATPRLLMERPEGQRLYGLHWNELNSELSTLRQQLQAADHINAGLEAKLSQCGGDNCLGLVVGEVASWVTVAARDAAVAAERERCAAICDQRAADLWHDYKDPGSPFRGDGRIEAMSDEAEECAKAIRADGVEK